MALPDRHAARWAHAVRSFASGVYTVPKKTIDQIDVASQRVLMRVDFNVPLDGGTITDDRRIRAALPSITSVLQRAGRLVLMSHLGRPDGTGYQPELSLEPVATRLSELLGELAPEGVRFPSHDCVDGAATGAAEMLADGECLLLENLRFHKAEKKGDPDFAQKLAAHGEVYCNNAFGTCHREDASMVAVPESMSGAPRVCGSLVEKEIRFLSDALADPQRPFVVVLGGAKVSDKLPAIEHLIGKADSIVVGGAMAYTFLRARGVGVGSSRVELEMVDQARDILARASDASCTIALPSDHVCSTTFHEKTGDNLTVSGDIPDGYMGLDIGPDTRDAYAEILSGAKTVVWNGPMGVFEWDLFSVGTRQVGQAIARATGGGATSIVGGGDSAAAADRFGLADQLSHVSTGGGASLEMLSGKSFRSVELLDDV